MTIDEALQLSDEWTQGHTFYEGMVGWRVAIATLAAEVRQLRIERDETKKNHGYSCHVCGALRRECEIMKRTSDDVVASGG